VPPVRAVRVNYSRSQLTYAKSGFTKVVDLGEWWKKKLDCHCPLVGNVIRKVSCLYSDMTLSKLCAKSIDFGWLIATKRATRLPYARDMNGKAADNLLAVCE